jgi:hypothetical protein
VDIDPAAFERIAALRREHLEPLVGDLFRVCHEPDAAPLRLIEVTDLTRAKASPRFRPAFSILFVDTGPGRRPQRIHLLDHPALGELALMLVPVGPGEGGELYEAVFH